MSARTRLSALATATALVLAATAAHGQAGVAAQRSQSLCQWAPVAADDGAKTVLLDSAAAWQRHVLAGAGAPASLRTPRWAQEQVLLHVLPEQPTMGVRVSALRVQPGPVLVLQVTRPARGQMSAMALSRPCVWVVVPRQTARGWKVRVQDSSAGPAQTHTPRSPGG